MDTLIKKIKNGRMLKNTGSWLYCGKCNSTVGYLCYSTYHNFRFEFNCKCGNNGSFVLKYDTKAAFIKSKKRLNIKKNRLRCPKLWQFHYSGCRFSTHSWCWDYYHFECDGPEGCWRRNKISLWDSVGRFHIHACRLFSMPPWG